VSFFFIDDTSGLSPVTYVGTAESTGANITIPATAQSGDIAVLYDAALNSSGSPTLVTPAGWTNKVNSTLVTNYRAAVCVKVLDGSDAGMSITGMSGTSENSKQMLVFRPATVAGSVTFSTFNTEYSSGNPSAQVAAASGQTPPVIVLGGCGTRGTPVFSSVSPAFDAQVTPSHGRLRMGYKIYDIGGTPADHTVDMNDLGNPNHLWSGYVTLA